MKNEKVWKKEYYKVDNTFMSNRGMYKAGYETYNETLSDNKTLRFLHKLAIQKMNIESVLIEMYNNIEDGTQGEFIRNNELYDFYELLCYVIIFYYIDRVKSNPNPISDKMINVYEKCIKSLPSEYLDTIKRCNVNITLK